MSWEQRAAPWGKSAATILKSRSQLLRLPKPPGPTFTSIWPVPRTRRYYVFRQKLTKYILYSIVRVKPSLYNLIMFIIFIQAFFGHPQHPILTSRHCTTLYYKLYCQWCMLLAHTFHQCNISNCISSHSLFDHKERVSYFLFLLFLSL